jgi:TatD DNase family protein
MYVDSHCHLDFPELFTRIDEVLTRMRERGVGYALCISVTLERFPQVLNLVERFSNLYATVGVHPDEQDARTPSVSELVKLAGHPKVVGIGETGLDYYRLQGDLEWQQERFRIHIRAARQCAKPLVIHTRSAAADTLRIMEEEGANEVGGVMHCFTESWQVAQAALGLDFHISFSGIVTFKNAAALKDVARRVPLERLLIETDSPYLTPVPYRGKTNEPAYVVHVAEEIARLRNVPVHTIEKATTENFFRLFRITPFPTGQALERA